MGVVIVAVIVGVVAFALRASEGIPVGRFTYAQVELRDVGALLVGDDVRMNSVRIGRIEQIKIAGDHTVVDMKIDGALPLYRDASAALLSRSPLGQKFVNLDPGTPSAGPLPGGIIHLDRTTGTNELDTLLDVFDPRTRQALAGFLRETGSGAAGHGADLQALFRAAPTELPDLGTVSEALASPAAALPALLTSAERLSSRFTGREQHITQLINAFGVTLRAFAVDNGAALDQSLRTLPDTLDHADHTFRVVDAPLSDTESAMSDLRSGAQALGDASPDVRGVLTEGQTPLRKVPEFNDHADPAIQDLTGTAADLRPLSRHLAEGLDNGRTPLAVLAPYAADIVDFFGSIDSSISQGDGDKHWLRLLVLPASDELTGTALIKDPTLERNPYPAPGAARKIRKTSVLGGTR